jgi:hypothetical protein
VRGIVPNLDPTSASLHARLSVVGAQDFYDPWEYITQEHDRALSYPSTYPCRLAYPGWVSLLCPHGADAKVAVDRAWLASLLARNPLKLMREHAVPVLANQWGVKRSVPISSGRLAYANDVATLFEQGGVHSALWIWRSYRKAAWGFELVHEDTRREETEDLQMMAILDSVWARDANWSSGRAGGANTSVATASDASIAVSPPPPPLPSRSPRSHSPLLVALPALHPPCAALPLPSPRPPLPLPAAALRQPPQRPFLSSKPSAAPPPPPLPSLPSPPPPLPPVSRPTDAVKPPPSPPVSRPTDAVKLAVERASEAAAAVAPPSMETTMDMEKHGPACRIEWGTRRDGERLRSVGETTLSACCAACRIAHACAAFNFDSQQRRCYMLKEVGSLWRMREPAQRAIISSAQRETACSCASVCIRVCEPARNRHRRPVLMCPYTQAHVHLGARCTLGDSHSRFLEQSLFS